MFKGCVTSYSTLHYVGSLERGIVGLYENEEHSMLDIKNSFLRFLFEYTLIFFFGGYECVLVILVRALTFECSFPLIKFSNYLYKKEEDFEWVWWFDVKTVNRTRNKER